MVIPPRTLLNSFSIRPVGGGDHRRPLAGHDVDRVVAPPLAARFIVGVAELAGLDPDDRDGEARRADLDLLGDRPPAARARASPSTMLPLRSTSGRGCGTVP